MKQSFSSDKINLAWFKLEEFVARGEKERALTMYRLLMHSINNEAVKHQLEGDILRAFNDKGAVYAYVKAAQIYEKTDKLIQAAELYELINDIMPDSYEYGKAMLKLYQQLFHTAKIYTAAQHLLSILIKRDQLVMAHELVQEMRFDGIQQATLHSELVIAIISSNKTLDEAFLETHLKAAIKYFLQEEGSSSLQLNQFLTKIAVLNDQVHYQAQQLLIFLRV
jgi:tetratricopeptide (TPR) repeat protein